MSKNKHKRLGDYFRLVNARHQNLAGCDLLSI